MRNLVDTLLSRGVLGILARVVAYGLALQASFLLSGDNPAVAGVLFLLFTFSLELLRTVRIDGARSVASLACVAMMTAAGVFLVHDAASHTRASSAAHTVEARVADMLRDTPGLVLSTDGVGTIEAVSPALLELTGYEAAELVGRPVSLLFSADAESFRIAESQAMGDRSKGWVFVKKGGVEMTRKDGSSVRVTKLIFGLRHSVGRRFERDVQFVSVITEE